MVTFINSWLKNKKTYAVLSFLLVSTLKVQAVIINWKYDLLESKIVENKLKLKVKANGNLKLCESISINTILETYFNKVETLVILESKNVQKNWFDLYYKTNDQGNVVPWYSKGTYDSNQITIRSDSRPFVLSGLASSLKKAGGYSYLTLSQDAHLNFRIIQDFEYEIPGYMLNSVFQALVNTATMDAFKRTIEKSYNPVGHDLKNLCQP